MKIYTSSKSKFGKKLNVLNNEVQFNKIGEAEVEDSFGKKMIKYNSEVYSSEPFSSKSEPVKPEKVDNKNEFLVEELKDKIEKLKKQDESRVSTINDLKKELADFKESYAKVVEENKGFKTLLEEKEEQEEKNEEVETFRKQLEEKEVEELKSTCSQMEIEEGEWKRLQKKEKIIDVIIKHAFEQ